MSCRKSTFIGAIAVLLSSAATVAAPEVRGFKEVNFLYEFEIPLVKKGEGPLNMYIPLADNGHGQEVMQRRFTGISGAKVKKDPKYGNLYLHLEYKDTEDMTRKAGIHYKIRLKDFTIPAGNGAETLSEDQKALFLTANKRVPIGGPILKTFTANNDFSAKTATKSARKIYDFVVDTMEYKKVGEGWGNGDTHWACSEKYGNCTDFHALFTSLARSEGIPAKFEIGVPISRDAAKGEPKGYHCWVRYHSETDGWVPVDASEAKKNPELRDELFGGQPADRIRLSTGRDLRLEGSQHELNYFVYPHAEISGKVVEKVDTRFFYQVLETSSKTESKTL